jgi:Holliday junction resolvasome RuvABC endonuclease subunit
MGEMVSIGFDPSLTGFGYAIRKQFGDGSFPVCLGTGRLETKPSNVLTARLVEIRNLVENLLLTWSPDVVGIESPAYDAGVFQTMHFCIQQYALEAVFKHRTDVVLFDPSTLKSLVRGSNSRKGIITKNDVLRHMEIDLGHTVQVSSDESDAYAVSKFAARFWGFLYGTVEFNGLTESEQRIFANRTKMVKTLKGPTTRNQSYQFRENDRWFRFSEIPADGTALPTKKQVIDRSLLAVGAEHGDDCVLGVDAGGAYVRCILTDKRAYISPWEARKLVESGMGTEVAEVDPSLVSFIEASKPVRKAKKESGK